MARLGGIALFLLVVLLVGGLLWLVAAPEPPPPHAWNDLDPEEAPQRAPDAVQLRAQATREPDASDAPARAALPPPATGPYQFFAMSSETEGALAGVEISTAEGERLGSTGPDGRLRIEDGEAAELNIVATFEGHVPFQGVASAQGMCGILMRPGISIAGRVRSALDGEPIVGANLRVWDLDLAHPLSASATNEEGHFDIPSVRPNHPFLILISAPGFVPVERIENFDVSVTDLDIEVGGGGTLEGHVRFRRGGAFAEEELLLVRAGEPVPGHGALPGRGRRDLAEYDTTRLGRTMTDEKGFYRFHGIENPSGVQTVAIVGPRFQCRSETAMFGKEDSTIERDIEIPDPASLRIEVVDERKLPLPGTRITVTTATEQWIPTRKDRLPDGTYLLRNLSIGQASVHATLDGAPTPVPNPTQSPLLRSGQEETATIEFPAGLGLQGIVQDKRGDPVLKARISWTGVTGTARTSGVTDGEGRFSFTRLPDEPGTLWVHARNVLNSRRGYETYKDEAVRPGASLLKIRLKDGTQVVGTFPDLDPNALLEVTLAPGQDGDSGTAWMDKTHRFTWRGPPKDRAGRIVFRTPGYPPLLKVLSPAFGSEEVRDLGDLSFEPTYPARGKILSPHGRPVRAAKVTLLDPWFGGRAQRTNRDGEFEFSRLPEEDVPIAVHARGFPVNRVMLGVNSHKVRQVIRIQAKGQLELTLLRRRGLPAAQARVSVHRSGPSGRHAPPAKAGPPDNRGRLTLELEPGTYEVRAMEGNGTRKTSLELEIRAAETHAHTLLLETSSERAHRLLWERYRREQAKKK